MYLEFLRLQRLISCFLCKAYYIAVYPLQPFLVGIKNNWCDETSICTHSYTDINCMES